MSPDTITLDDLFNAMDIRIFTLRSNCLSKAPRSMGPLVAHVRGSDLDDRETRLKVERVARSGRKVRTTVVVHVDEPKTEYSSPALFGGSFTIRDFAAQSGSSIEVHWAST